MNVVILYNDIPPDAPQDEMDVLDEVRFVSEVLTRPGLIPIAVPLTLDLERATATLNELRPDLVFNLVESVDGKGSLIHLAPALLDHLRLPYTGATTEAMFLTSNKVITKQMLHTAGLPTLPWVAGAELHAGAVPFDPPYILKSTWEHASVGVHEHSVIAEADDLPRILERYCQNNGHGIYLEPYLDGRELTVSVLGGRSGMEVLPPAEILFEDYPEGKLRIFGYKAKWEEDSFEYNHVIRTSDFAPEDQPLVDRARELAARCWDLFGLRGYARVDFRVDDQGQPWIIEVNANPCLNPETGLAASAQEAGIEYPGVIERIIQDTIPDFFLGA